MNRGVRVASASGCVIAAAVLATYVVAANHFFSPWNWLWILGFPIAAIIVFFRRFSPWVWLGGFVWLTTCSFATFMLSSLAFGIGT